MHSFRRIGLHRASLAPALLLALTASASSWASEATIHAGEPVAVGNGTGRVIVATDSAGVPTSVSVVLTGSALDGLPAPDPAPAPAHKAWEYILPMPASAPETGYDHVGLDWNPHGHIPQGVYSLPHFDVHFYVATRAERAAMTFRGPDAERHLASPDSSLVPAGYVVPPDSAVEGMGTHGLDPRGHEFHGKPFTHTFLYGYYGGELVFVEPMVTLDFLKTRADVTVPVRTPAAYSRAGYYPDRYRLGFDASRDEYRVALLGLRPFTPGGNTARR